LLPLNLETILKHFFDEAFCLKMPESRKGGRKKCLHAVNYLLAGTDGRMKADVRGVTLAFLFEAINVASEPAWQYERERGPTGCRRLHPREKRIHEAEMTSRNDNGGDDDDDDDGRSYYMTHAGRRQSALSAVDAAAKIKLRDEQVKLAGVHAHTETYAD